MHVALAGGRAQGVELLLHAQHVQRGDPQDLGLAALEQRRAVRARDHVDLGGQRPDVGEPTAVDTDLVAQDALADRLLGHRAQGGADLLLAAFELLGELLSQFVLDRVEGVLALLLVGDRQGLRHLVAGSRLNRGVGVVLVVQEHRELAGLLAGAGSEVGLCLAQLPDELLRGLEALGDHGLGRRRGTTADQFHRTLSGLRLDHHDGDVVTDHTTGDDHVEHGVLDLRVARKSDPPLTDQGNAHGADRAAERQTGQLGGHRRGVDGQHVVGVVGVERLHRDDDLDLVAQALDEGRAQRAVDQTAGEDGVLAGTALSAEERTGDPAEGVHPLLDVHGEREEVELVLRGLPGGGGGQQHGVAIQVCDC